MDRTLLGVQRKIVFWIDDRASRKKLQLFILFYSNNEVLILIINGICKSWLWFTFLCKTWITATESSGSEVQR